MAKTDNISALNNFIMKPSSVLDNQGLVDIKKYVLSSWCLQFSAFIHFCLNVVYTQDVLQKI